MSYVPRLYRIEPYKAEEIKENTGSINENKVEKFISKGGSLAAMFDEKTEQQQDDHRLTLRIPKFLMDKVDKKRKQRIGTISRNLWILEIIERATRDIA